MIMLSYMVVRKTKKQTTAGINTGLSCEACEREAGWVKKHSQGLFPAAESRLPDDNIIVSLYYSEPQDKEADDCTLRHWI
jgi:hypothetical protein